MKLLTAIVPCYNEEKVLPLFYQEIIRIADLLKNDVRMEFLFVNDGSADKTLEILKSFRSVDKRVKIISFSRNFGKEAAMYAGLEHSKGDLSLIHI